jgi:hypothetical protein
MKRYLLGLIGLAVFGASLLIGRTLAFGGESRCVEAVGCPEAGCNGSNGCCPQCGCRLVAVCHTSCTTKKVTEYKYVCKCEDMCVPGVTPICKKCQSCENSGECAVAGDTCNNGCQEGCGGRCLVREVHKLTKYPVTKDVPVRKCTVEWVCPQCDCHGNCAEGAAPSAPMPSSAPVPPAPTPSR